MYLKGRMKIKTSDIVPRDNEMYVVTRYLNELNEKYQKSKSNYTVVFYSKNNDKYKNDYEDSFDNIVNSILEEDNSKIRSSSKYGFTFFINYYIKTGDAKVSINDIKINIETFIKNAKSNNIEGSSITIYKHTLVEQKSIDAFDDLINNKPSEIQKFYKGLLNENEISILSNTFTTLKIKKKEFSTTKFNEDALLKKYNDVCKDDRISKEIHRIYSIKDNKNIQGVNYLFKEENYDIRQAIYKVLATALYSNGRLDNPYYYVVNVEVKDSNTRSNILYLQTRFKVSRNEIYFFEFTNKDSNDDMFSNHTTFSNVSDKFFKSMQENQFLNIFSIYAEEDARNYCNDLEEKELTEKLSMVVFSDKLNVEAQLDYVRNKLEKLYQLDVFPAMKDIIEYQNTQVDGLSTNELDDFILTVFKSKYEKVYRPAYEHITKDLSNGDMTKKLMGMVGLKNLKQAVTEMCNKVNFKNIKEELLPATKILNQMNNYERNNWILTGVPGTGKSTGAEILEKIMYQERIIKKDLIVKYTPSDDNDEFMITPFGPMQIKTSSNLRDSFCESVGGVLIVDEIGHLTDEDKSLLLQLMEDYKRDVCVILCGYENEAKALLDYNPGFRSRFNHIIKMEEYNAEELLEILIQKLGEKHFVVEDDAKNVLRDVIDTVSKMPNFGQARFMESMSDKLIAIHSNNKLKYIDDMLKQNSDAKIDEKDIYSISKEDVGMLKPEDMLGEEYELIKKHKDASSELKNLIGCDQVKKVITEFVAKSRLDKIKIDKKLIDKTSMNMNMVFYGNPGTAKTTVARLAGKILYDKGVISKEKMVEVGAADLVAAYVGQTALKTTAVFEEAKGGVLFIDEAYTLANDSGGFNQEAIDTIIKEMENHRNDTMVIFAGYKDKMEAFIEKNPGFKSRISRFIDFPNYSIEELVKIFEKLYKDAGYELVSDDKEQIFDGIKNYLKDMISEKQFGNGRVCRTILENAVNAQSYRLLNKEDISDNDLMTLKLEDFAFLGNPVDFGKEKKNDIGFKAAA